MIAVLATCFNRRETTLRGLASLRLAAQDLPYHVYLVDDGSTDGTGTAVRAAFPEVTVIEGDGSLYWNGGMRRAWQTAVAAAPDYYLWWNDDLMLHPTALDTLLAWQHRHESRLGAKVISVGKVTDPDTGATTYGGFARVPGLSRLRFTRAHDDGQTCVSFNGNCVLVPARAVADVGIHSVHYRHSSGDHDYALRATQAGYRIVQCPDPVGTTPYNHEYAYKLSRLTRTNWRFVLTHPKGIPVGEWLHFSRTHGGWLWPVNFIVRYLKLIALSS